MIYVIKDKTDLQKQLAEAGEKLVVMDFFATWCGPCEMIAPKLEEFAKEFTDVVFLKVDVDACEDIADEYKVDSMPTFFFMKKGVKLESFDGDDVAKVKSTIIELK